MDVKLPNLGEGADSGTVVNLFVKEGDKVIKDQPLIELENEKAVASIPSSTSGTVEKLFVKIGDKINVGQRILSLSDGGGAGKSAAPAAKGKPRAAAPESEPESESAVEAGAGEPAGTVEESMETPRVPAAPVAASPTIRKLARDLGLDLTRVRGSARGGRIVISDLRVYIERLQKLAAQPRAKAAPGAKPVAESIDFSKWGPVTPKPFSPLREVIARRMLENWNTIPHVTQFDEADITGLLALRKKHVSAYEKKGVRLTVTSFLLKAVVDVLRKHAIFNASLDEASQQLVFKNYHHIGIAVDTEAGLIVPVLRDADKKDLLELSRDLETLAAKARERKVTGDELKGGTFTISNQGGIGGAHFTPIINKPEVAILGLGRAALKAVVRDGKIESRTMLPLALSYDHRVIDGAQAARFMVDLVGAIEGLEGQNPAKGI